MTTSHNTKQQQIVCFGEILWDLLPSGPVPGGAPMNVAYHLHTLGFPAAIVTRLGTDPRGTELLRILQSQNIATEYIQVDEAVATGIVHARADEHGDMKYEIVSPAAWDEIQLDPALTDLVASADYFIFGSLSARAEMSRSTLFSLLESAREKVFDINLRAPHYSQALLEQLMQKAGIVKMNSDELALVSGWYNDAVSTRDQMQFLMERFNISSILITRGAEGAIICYKGEWAEHPGFRVKVADTVGSGDSFLAGFISSVIGGAAVVQALEFACALGSFVATTHGAWPAYDKARIEDFIARAAR